MTDADLNMLYNNVFFKLTVSVGLFGRENVGFDIGLMWFFANCV